MKLQNKAFQTSFIVFPADTNYMYPMVFGGKMLAEMDICAATTVRRALHGTECDSAVTVSVREANFHIGAVVGDLIFLTGEIVKLGIRSINVKVTGRREDKDGQIEDICEGEFIFVSRRNEVKHPHGLTME